jgi:1-acyl-sn-glycerol-3-phosphate acyltransferase
LKRLRAIFRLSRTALHVLNGALTVALVYPRSSAERRLKLKQRWSAQLVNILGVELRYRGEEPPPGLIVANHISFLDIYVINAVTPASFVSKDDVRRWPLIGWLAANTDTIFMARGSRSAP